MSPTRMYECALRMDAYSAGGTCVPGLGSRPRQVVHASVLDRRYDHVGVGEAPETEAARLAVRVLLRRALDVEPLLCAQV